MTLPRPVQKGELIAEFVAQEELQCDLVATRSACVNSLALVVQKLDNLMDKGNAIVEFLILIQCIPWRVIYSVDSAIFIQHWDNRDLHDLGLFLH